MLKGLISMPSLFLKSIKGNEPDNYQLYNYLVKGQQCTRKFSLSQPLI